MALVEAPLLLAAINEVLAHTGERARVQCWCAMGPGGNPVDNLP